MLSSANSEPFAPTTAVSWPRSSSPNRDTCGLRAALGLAAEPLAGSEETEKSSSSSPNSDAAAVVRAGFLTAPVLPFAGEATGASASSSSNRDSPALRGARLAAVARGVEPPGGEAMVVVEVVFVAVWLALVFSGIGAGDEKTVTAAALASDAGCTGRGERVPAACSALVEAVPPYCCSAEGSSPPPVVCTTPRAEGASASPPSVSESSESPNSRECATSVGSV